MTWLHRASGSVIVGTDFGAMLPMSNKLDAGLAVELRKL
jgi:hypothetical protein